MSDIFVGSTMGFLVGRYVYKTHHDSRIDGHVPSRAERLVPNIGVGGLGVTLSWKL